MGTAFVHVHSKVIYNGRQYWFTCEDQRLTFADVLDRWEQEEQFVSTFCQVLHAVPYDAYFFETPPMISSWLDKPFEFVLINSGTLAKVSSEERFFAEHFQRGNGNVISFANLSEDATLVVPRPTNIDTNYAHLAVFIRTATQEEKRDLWKLTARRYKELIGTEKRWLSTSGLGVYWLHLRIDRRPKYYTHHPYRN